MMRSITRLLLGVLAALSLTVPAVAGPLGVGNSLGEAALRSQRWPAVSFNQAVTGFALYKDYSFGTNAAPAGSTRIANVTDLAVDWDPLEHGTGATTINFELQRYRDFSFSQNFVFTPDSIELTGTVDTPDGGPQVKTTTFSSAAANTRTIQVADASNIYIGSVVSVAAQNDQMQFVNSMSVRSSMAAGRTFTVTIKSAIGEFADQTTTITATGSDTTSTIAAQVVAWVNANPALAGRGISAIINPQLSSCLYLTWPRRQAGPSTGRGAAGSFTDVTLTASSSTGTFNVAQTYAVMHVIAKSGTTLTLNQPITAAAGDTLFVSPARILHATAAAVNSSTQPVADTTGIEVGQGATFSFQDSNLRRITAKTATSLTFEASVGMGDGIHIAVYPAYSLLTSAANTSTTSKLLFASVPTGVQPGHRVFFANQINVTENTVVSVDRASTPQSVTMSTPTSVGSGARIYIYPNIGSAQIWSKWIVMPEQGQSTIAMEWYGKIPPLAAHGSFPAWWLFADTTDPNPGPIDAGNSREIDMFEGYNYWNIPGNSNQMTPGVPNGSSSTLYVHPDYATGMRGNNFGNADHKIGFIWQKDRWALYYDDVLMMVRLFTYNPFKRPQIGMNLAIGSVASSFNSNGLFPIDLSQFPMKYRLRRFRVWKQP